MRLNSSLKLRHVGSSYFIVDAGQASVDMSYIITLSPAAAYLWETFLEREFTVEMMVDSLCARYDGKERKGSDAYIMLNSIPAYYQFSGNWDRRYSDEDNVTTSTDWHSLVPLTWSKVNISKVTADLRITYFQEE